MVARETSLRDGLAALGIAAPEEAVARLALLADILHNRAMGLGFLGPNEGPRIVPRHVLESAALARHVARDGPVVDVGSGAGLPGLVLASLGYEVTMVESLVRRAEFLRQTSDALSVKTRVLQERAEDVGRAAEREEYRTAVARALGSFPVTMELCLPLVRPGGSLTVLASPIAGQTTAEDASKPGPSTPVDDAWTSDRQRSGDERAGPAGEGAADLGGQEATSISPAPMEASARLEPIARLLGGGVPRWIEFEVPGVDEPRWVMIVDKLQPTPARFPRRPGVPKRRPLGGGVASVN